MTILTISNLDSAKDCMSQLVAGDRKLIGVGIVVPASENEMKVALIDVTDEVKQGHLDTANPILVNAFIHSHQEEIQKQINDTLTPAQWRVAGTC